MSTLAEIGAPTRRRSPFIRIILWLLLLVVLMVVGAVTYAYYVAESALPQLDGQSQVADLRAAVTVTRDSHGVPTIEAASLEDLFFAQGYVTAQDRLWQMDVMRRFGSGELSEILGEQTLKLDREQRILGLRAAAKKSLEIATVRDRGFLEAYARGVNAYIAARANHLPIEFRILDYAPKPWTAEDSVVVANSMVKDLNYHYFFDALSREKILAKLGPELTADLYVNRSWHDRPPTVMREDVNAPEKAPSDSDDEDDEDAPDNSVTQNLVQLAAEEIPVNGSNDWVVSGAHTVTGKPLLSNDMHLGHQMPNLWYEAHLKSGMLDVAGVTLPGMPYVIVGHNQRVAWGFTNVGPTVTDVYVENFNSDGAYQTPKGWLQPEHRTEVIHVKGKPDSVVDVQITRHGPIVSELAPPGETRKIALRWTLYDGIRNPFFSVDSAQDWDQFRRAFSEFDAPGQNVVYADVDGNIGYQATGKVPIRAGGDGSLPVDGSNNAHEWIGYIPFDKLPSVLNPPAGIIATANARITPDKYPFSISAEWEAPWRIERIYRVLASGKKFSTADMLALQNDIYSELDHFVADKLVYAVDHAKNASLRAKQAAEILRQWNGQMDADSAAPTIASRARVELKRMLLEPKLGAALENSPKNGPTLAPLSWQTYHWMMETVWLENVLSHQPARWLPSNYSSYDDLLATAVEQTAKKAPADLNAWKWGPEESVTIQNPILGKIPVIRRWTGPGEKPQSGSGYTVKAAGRDYGPSERFTADLSNLDASTLNVVTGESGNFLSPNYMDQWKAWYMGYTFVLPFSKTAVENAATHRLMLEPK